MQIALFAETEPEQMITELADLYDVEATAALNSSEALQRLRKLSAVVRDYPLAP